MANPHIIKILPSLLQHHFTEPIIRNHMINVIGYGSGVFPQQSTVQKNNNTIDLIIITKSASNFHSHFHSFKFSDYEGFSRVFGPSYIKFLNSYVFPLHFNHINIQNYKVKYSIVDYYTFVEDLSKWKYLTLAGRMHKPVLSHPINTENNNKEISLISSQINKNYENAFKIALLRLIGKKKTNIPFS